MTLVNHVGHAEQLYYLLELGRPITLATFVSAIVGFLGATEYDGSANCDSMKSRARCDEYGQ